MTNMTENNVSVRGVNVTNTTIGNSEKALGSINERLTVWANAAALQYTAFNNNKWIDRLFSVDELRLVSGGLSAKGREVAAYIQRFSPIIVREVKGENANEKAVSISMTKNKKKKGSFFSLERDENDQPVRVNPLENPDFPMDLREYTALASQKNASKKGASAPKASQLAARTEKLAAAFESEESEVEGSLADFTGLAEKALELYHAALAAANRESGREAEKANANASQLDQMMADAPTSPSEKRADADREKHAANA